MQLLSVHLERVRKFREPFELHGLSAGINLIHGPNEVGKSTIQAAIAAVFTERYSSQAPQQDLAPNDMPDARPLVQVTFLHEGVTYELSKEFYRRGGTCVLRSGSTVLSGDEAVARLVELFRFEAPQARVITESQLGLPGVFWVPQGRSLGAQAAMEHARSFFVREIGEEIGSSRETAADALIARLERVRGEVVTPTGRGGPLAAARRELEASMAALAEQEQRKSNSEGLRDRLEQLQARLGLLVSQGVEAMLIEELGLHQRRKEELSRALEERARVASALAGLGDQIGYTEERLHQLAEEQAQLAEARLAIADVERSINECQTTLTSHQEARATLGARTAAMAAKRRFRDLMRDRQERQDQLSSIDEQDRQLRSALVEVEEIVGQINEIQDRLAGLEFGEGSEVLAQLEASVAQLRSRLQTLSTMVAIEVEEVDRLYIDGQLASGSRVLMLEEEMTLAIPGVVKISLTPQESAAVLREELNGKDSELQRRLVALGVESAADLRLREREYRELTLSLQNLTRERMRLEGEGESIPERLARLERLREAQTARLRDIETELGELSDVDDGDQSLEDLDQLTTMNTFHAAEIDRLEGELGTLRREQIRLSEAISWLQTSVERQGDEQGMSALQVQREELVSQRAERVAELEVLGQLIGSEDLATVEDRITSYEERLGEHRLQVQQCREQRQEVLGQMRADPFSEEELAAAEVKVEQAKLLVTSLEERSSALTVLIEIARDIVAEVQHDLNAPMQGRINRYAQQLFGEAAVELDDSFAPQQLVRGRTWESIDRLSWGTREQMALLTRLGVADLMAERGVPVFLMLDDAMLNADGVRLMRLKSILSSAQQRYQILLFTCRPELFSDLVGARSYELGATPHS
ncbi:AAA family ATPase [Ferrimicrobium sp.]|uniref:AAA family ATPase n=1 Tax=Ferrimicrobium sp. TaxID=2926050 RepID=UPI00262EF4FB|nr:AAA family ATPase [Ferrimicrobium sp.]